jgi:hypothetical protein
VEQHFGLVLLTRDSTPTAMKALLLIITAFVLAALATELTRWHVAGDRSNWVTLNDATSSSVVVASDLEGIKVLCASPPSQAWKQRVSPSASKNTLASVREQYGVAVRSRRVVELPNGTRARVVGRADFVDQRFQAPKPMSAAELRHEGGVELIQIEIREGPNKGLTGWLLPELVQHEVAWP